MMTPATFEQLFTYGQTRERYAMPSGEHLDSNREIIALVRPEHLADLKKAILHDQTLLENRSDTQWQLQLSMISRQCLWEMHSGIFLRLLENITGYSQLLPDAKCHFLAVHTRMGNNLHLEIWQDTETDLPVVLYVLLGLDSGNATLIPETHTPVAINEPSLQLAYYYFSGTPA